MSHFGKSCLLAVVWLAAVCRLPALFDNTFHADEALFALWARLIAVWRDPLLLTQAVDKPPLLFYLQAPFYPLLGPVEWAARLPNLIASLLLVPLVALLAWRIYRNEWVALIAGLIVALSPLGIQFSATAFTDPLLTALLMASLVVASSKLQFTGAPIIHSIEYSQTRRLAGSQTRRLADSPTYSGLLFGLAVATKHQAWLFLPLLSGVALLSGWRRRQWRRWLAGLAPVLLLLLLWEVVRTGGLALWPMQLANFGGIRPIWSWELQPRLLAWLAQWQYVAAPPLLIAGIAAATGLLLRAWRGANRAAAFDLLFVLYLAAYALMHWLLAVPVWDRYLLPAVPMAALILSRSFWQIVRNVQRLIREKTCANSYNSSLLPLKRINSYPCASLSLGIYTTLLILLLALQLPGAWQARSGHFPIGGRPAADSGAAAVAQALAGLPYGTVLYDHWYSWQWRYHLFDGRVYVGWFPHPSALAEDLAAFGRDGNPRYLALPDDSVALPVRRAVTRSGFRLQPVAICVQDGIILYQILPIR